MLSGVSPIFDALNSNFNNIFGDRPKERQFTIEVIPIIAAPADQEEQQHLDPASQTGDFVFPRDPLREVSEEFAEINALADRIINGTATDADRARLQELSEPEDDPSEDREPSVGRLFLEAIEEVDEEEIEEIERRCRDLDDANEVEGVSFDLTHEELRIYHFPDGVEVEVDNPHTLTIGADGTHYITPFDRVGVEIPPRWFKVEVFPKQGEACFDGHPPVNEIA